MPGRIASDVTPITEDLHAATVRQLRAAGCVAAEEEATELAQAAAGDPDVLTALLQRRVVGEPLAWITGHVTFCDERVGVDQGVYVPRWQSEALAERAAALLPPHGRAIDLATGAGAIATVLRARRPGASVLGTDDDPLAVACARRNGVTVVEGDLFDGVATDWRATVDIVVGVLPYVPTRALEFLPRDVRDFEPLGALAGGADGLDLVRRAVAAAPGWLRTGGRLLLEVGADQIGPLRDLLQREGFVGLEVIVDPDGDPRGVDATAG